MSTMDFAIKKGANAGGKGTMKMNFLECKYVASYPVLKYKQWNCVSYFGEGNCVYPKIMSGLSHT